MAKYRIKAILLALVILTVYLLSACQSVEHTYIKTKAKARTEVWKAITNGTASSASVAIMDNGKLIYTDAFGMADRENNIPADKNTVFNIGSISKLFAATSIMLLVDEGIVALDNPVTDYLQEFTMADERYKDITVRMLLNHSSGLPGSTFWNNFGYEYNQNIYKELLTSLSRSYLKHRPGELAAYCNDGFTLAEMLVTEVTDKSYSDFLAERLFKPLNMKNTGFGVGRLSEGMIPAKFYHPDGKAEPLEVVSLLASGGISSTAEDLCKFADSFSKDLMILSTQSRMEMLAAQPSELQGKLQGQGFPFGLGWDYADIEPYSGEELRLYGKSGGTGQYSAMLYTIPSQRISVAFIASGPQCNSSEIAYNILSSYLEEKGLIVIEEGMISLPVKAQPIPSELMNYEGYYDSGSNTLRIELDNKNGMMIIYLVDGGNESAILSAVYNGGYFYDGDNRFYLTSVDGTDYFMEYESKFAFYKIKAEKFKHINQPLELSISLNNQVWLRRNVRAFEETLLLPTHIISSSEIPGLPGYVNFNGLKVVRSLDYADMSVRSMRDLTELTLAEHNGDVWALLSGAEYMPYELAPLMNVGINNLIIGSEGRNEWLNASFDAILKFEIPNKGRVLVFGSESILYDNMVDRGEILVPAGSLIEVAGNPGDKFQVVVSAVD